MAPSNKPVFLKTFAELTIDELRSMPLHRVFALFFREITSTVTDGSSKVKAKPKKSATVKKKPDKPILTAKLKPSPGFTEAMKRVFTPGPIANYEMKRKELLTKSAEKTGEHQKNDKKHSETVVFPKQNSEENQARNILQ